MVVILLALKRRPTHEGKIRSCDPLCRSRGKKYAVNVKDHPASKQNLLQPEKTADIWRRYYCFPLQMTSEKRAQKFYTDDASLPISG